MKTIEQLSVPKQVDSNFPFGAIINETDTTDGTPVIREIYNDLLVNNYKLLQEVGITPNNVEDSVTNGYQILEALKKLPNTLNDIERVLSLSTTVWSVPLNIDFLPNKYFFIGRASEDYVAGTSYTFKGTTATSYVFTSSGFKALDELLVIIDTSGVRAYSLNSGGTSGTEAFAVLGTPIAFNDTNKMWYEDDGKIMSDVPSVNNLESIIRVDVSDGTILLQNIFVMNGFVLCFCLKPSTNNYFFRQFAIGSLTASSAVSIVGTSFANSSDFSPYVYASSGVIYVTNAMNTTVNNYSVSKLNFTSGTLTFVNTTSLNPAFVKTSNAVIKFGLLYTMILGFLKSYDFTSGVETTLGAYSGVAGQLIGFNGQVYFVSGEVAKKWF